MGSIPGSGRSPGGGIGTPLQCSCLESARDRRAWWPTVCGIAESDVTKSKQQQHVVMDHEDVFSTLA